MINNLPARDDFKSLAKDCLIQTINNLFDIAKEYNQSKHDFYADLDENEIWQHHLSDLRTCLVLIYQGFEMYLKGEVCNESPYLLLDSQRKDWPTNPNSVAKDFNELYTISGEDLLRTFNAVNADLKGKEDINKVFNELRKKRNRITHSSPSFEITANYLIKTAIECFTFFEGKDQWWNLIRENIIDHPLSSYGDGDYEIVSLVFRLQFIKEKTGLKFLNKHSFLDLNARKYYCQYCYRYLNDLGALDLQISRWAVLTPNKPTSTQITCYNCQTVFEVSRTKCTNYGCKGNVLDIDSICLTCLEETSN